MTKDFKLYLEQLGVTEERYNSWIKHQDVYNLIEIESNLYYKKQSKTHGIGLFAGKDLEEEEYIGIVRFNNKRTTLARWINHSRNGNVDFLPYNNKKYPEISFICVSIRKIKKNTELKINYRYVN